MKKFSERLMVYRAENKLSQVELGKLLGVSQLTISRWETEVVTPKKKYKLLFEKIEKGE